MTAHVSEFQQRVYDELISIPQGKVTTYKWLATQVGCRSPRAIGKALSSNPFSPRVPCHRVITSDLTLGGFKGKKTILFLKEKRCLLSHEGVVFKNGRLSDITCLYVPEKK